jgi:hypothetical protein
MPSCQLIAEVVCEFYGVDLEELYSSRRPRHVIIPRHVSMYLSKKMTLKSLPEIGRNFGGRDHTTVIAACRSIAKLAEEQPLMAEELGTLETIVLATEGVLIKAGMPQPIDIDPLMVASRILSEPMTRSFISGDELKALATAVTVYASAPEPKPLVITMDLGPALRRATRAALFEHVAWQSAQFTRGEDAARRRFEAAFKTLKTLFEEKEISQ